MVIECICNDGFEDVLTVGEFYQVEPKGASFLLMNDRGRKAWYGRDKFALVFGAMV